MGIVVRKRRELSGRSIHVPRKTHLSMANRPSVETIAWVSSPESGPKSNIIPYLSCPKLIAAEHHQLHSCRSIIRGPIVRTDTAAVLKLGYLTVEADVHCQRGPHFPIVVPQGRSASPRVVAPLTFFQFLLFNFTVATFFLWLMLLLVVFSLAITSTVIDGRWTPMGSS